MMIPAKAQTAAKPVHCCMRSDELDATGYADSVTVDGVTVLLSDVVQASVRRPGHA